jgi:DNA polymerase kappa
MPGFIGDKLVEELSGGKETLVHVRSNFDLYKEKSRIVKGIVREYAPHNMKSYSLDEAFLDIGPYLALSLQRNEWTHDQIRNTLLQAPEKYTSSVAMQLLQSYSCLVCLNAVDNIASEIRRRVEEATGGLTCSIGVAPNVSLAKIASDKNKPNGQLLVDPSGVLEFVQALPIRKIPGIGRVTEKILQQVCNVDTVHHLYQQRGIVQFLFQPATAEFLLRASVGCNGTDSLNVSDFGMEDVDDNNASSSTLDHQKGISRERTFSPESDWTLLSIKLEDVARMVAKDMRKISVLARTVTVKVKLGSFDVLSKSQSLGRGEYIQNPDRLVTMTNQLFSQIRSQHNKENRNNCTSRFSVRLLGVRCSNLIDETSFECATKQSTMDKFLSASSHKINPDKTNRVSSIPCNHRQEPNDLLQRDTGVASTNDQAVESSPTKEDSGQHHVQCPLCHRSFPVEDNLGLNAHIDGCLNGSIIRETIKEEDSHNEGGSKRKKLTDFWPIG